MNTREIAKEYRLSHWAQKIEERKASGLSIRAYCKKEGFHENNYFYWQRKLREAVCEQINKLPTESRSLVAPNFVEVKLRETMSNTPTPASETPAQLHIELSGLQIKANTGYPVDKLAALLKELVSLC